MEASPHLIRGLFAHLKDLLVGVPAPPKDLSGDMLAVERTKLAHERTMMAWIRTGLSLISFGFTIYKFFEIQAGGGPFQEGLIGPRSFGFVMILTGLIAVTLGGLENRRQMRSFRAAGITVPPSLANLVGALILMLGVLGLFAVIFEQ